MQQTSEQSTSHRPERKTLRGPESAEASYVPEVIDSVDQLQRFAESAGAAVVQSADTEIARLRELVSEAVRNPFAAEAQAQETLLLDRQVAEITALLQEAQAAIATERSAGESAEAAIITGTNVERLPPEMLGGLQKILGDKTRDFLLVFTPNDFGKDERGLTGYIRGKFKINLTPDQATELAHILASNQERITWTPEMERMKVRLKSKEQIADFARQYQESANPMIEKRLAEELEKKPGLTAKEIAALRNSIQAEYRTKIVELTRMETASEEGGSFREIGVSPEILALVEASDPHSMDMVKYSENRFSKIVLERVIREKLPVEVYTGNAIDAIQQLRAQGFDQILKYATKDGDFQKCLATNPETGESKLVVITLPGKSYRLQIEGTLLLYANEAGEKIAPEQLKVFESETDLSQVYKDIFEAYQLRPETICIGNQSDLAGMLEARGITDTENISNPYMNGTIYHYRDADGKERNVLSVNISPHLYGDKLTTFTEVAAKMGVNRIAFTGTAGAIDTSFRLGEVVIPENVAYTNPGDQKEPLALRNAASEMLPDLSGDNLKTVPLHGTLHSPVLESMPVIEEIRESGIQTVECEIGNIAQGIANSEQPVEFFYYIMITDIPGTEYTNAEKSEELDPFYHGKPVIHQNDITKRILEQQLGLVAVPVAENKQETRKKSSKPKAEFAVEYQGRPAKLKINFSEPGLSELVNLEPIKKMVNKAVQAILAEGVITAEKEKLIEDQLHRIQKDYGLAAQVEFVLS